MAKRILASKNYYVRCGSRFQPMEYYMIEDALGRRRRPRLELGYSLWLRKSLF